MEQNAVHTDSDEFKLLQTLDEYTLYFKQLRVIFRKLLEVFIVKTGSNPMSKNNASGGPGRPGQDKLKQVKSDQVKLKQVKLKQNKPGQSFETAVISDFFNKMLYTADVFRKKYTYNPAHSLKVDITDSGFPGFMEISNIATDLLIKNDKLESLPTLQSLKQSMLDFMFKYKAEPEQLLSKISERAYYEMLDRSKLFLAFTPGTSFQINNTQSGRERKDFKDNSASLGLTRDSLKWVDSAERRKFRNYTYSWACYDFKTNRPYIHIMIFDQDIESVPLEKKGSNYLQFLEYIEAEGSRAPDIGILALGIDNNLKDIHPKVIKRIGIGPVCSKYFSKEPEDLSHLLAKHGENDDDFILLFEDEIIFSSAQQVSKSMFSFGQLKEIFHIPETDLECYKRRASKIHKYMLVPHNVLQHMDFKDEYKKYQNHEILTYSKKGGIYVN